MRRVALVAPLAATLLAGTALAQPAAVTVRVGGDLTDKVAALGDREVADQMARLQSRVEQTLTRRGALDGARIDLVLTDLKPNRPTFQQTIDRPGLSPIHSLSIGGATIEGEITTPDGRIQPVRFDRYSTSLQDVFGFTTWHDANRAYDRLANNLAEGRYVRR